VEQPDKDHPAIEIELSSGVASRGFGALAEWIVQVAIEATAPVIARDDDAA